MAVPIEVCRKYVLIFKKCHLIICIDVYWGSGEAGGGFSALVNGRIKSIFP